MTGTSERLQQAFLRRNEKNSNGKVRKLVPAGNSSTSTLSSVATVALLGASVLTLELTNAGTTFWALDSLMGDTGVSGIPFAVLLALGLTVLDTGGLYRLFRARAAANERNFAAWSVMGAWLLCSTSNAIMTWWTVSSTMTLHAAGNAVMSQVELMNVAPVFIALIIWLIRILLVAGYVQGNSG